MGRYIVETGVLLLLWLLLLTQITAIPAAEPLFYTGAAGFWLVYFSLPLWRRKSLAVSLMTAFYAGIHVLFFQEEGLTGFLLYPALLFLGAAEMGRDRWVLPFLTGAGLVPVIFLNEGSQGAALVYLLSLCSLGFALYLWGREKAVNLHIQEKTAEALRQYRQMKRQLFDQDAEVRQEERVRIARDIHDAVGHQLTSLVMQLEMMERSAADENLEQPIREAKQSARSALNDTREAVRQFRSEELPGGMNAVLYLLRKLERESHMTVHLETREGILSAPLTNEQNVLIYRFIQEGMTNAMRHARTREVWIMLSLLAGREVHMKMENRLHEKTAETEGSGLLGLRERFQVLEGSFRSEAGTAAFIIEGKFPLKKEELR
jgi:signal transduction histidine kinase